MADDTKLTPFPPRDALIQHREERLTNGMLFPLRATSIGFGYTIEARIRRITTIDKAILDQLPTDLQDVLFAGMTEFQKEQEKAKKNGDPKNLAEMLSNNSKIVDAANAWCKAAFIYPRLVDTEAELTGPNDRLVTDIEAEDRVAVLMLSLDADSTQIDKLRMFRPARATDVRHDEISATAEESKPSLGLVE